MKEAVQYLLFSVVVTAFLSLLRLYYPSIGITSSMATVVAITGVTLSISIPIIEFINYLAKQYSIEYISVLWKGLAISLLSTTASDLCRGAGENAIAEKVELLGKCEILVLSLPLLKQLLELATSVYDSV